jgi:hypothetical protein
MISAKNLKPTKPFVKAGQATETVNLHALITCPFSQKAFVFLEITMKLTDIDPLMIARPTVEVVDNNLNQAYLLSQLIWAIKEFRDSDIEWHIFDAEDFANQIGMPYDWLCSQAQDLAKYVFFGWRTWNRPRPIIQFNLHLFYQTLEESK